MANNTPSSSSQPVSRRVSATDSNHSSSSNSNASLRVRRNPYDPDNYWVKVEEKPRYGPVAADYSSSDESLASQASRHSVPRILSGTALQAVPYASHQHQVPQPIVPDAFQEQEVVSSRSSSHHSSSHDSIASAPGVEHVDLRDRLQFRPLLPSKMEPALPAPKTELTRLFIGQLPYDVTPSDVCDIVQLCTGGKQVYGAEIIVKFNHGVRTPTGCSHAYCYPDDADTIIAAMNKRVLVDTCGAWTAKTEAEAEVLKGYCNHIKKDRSRRFPNLPCDSVVVQLAMSQFKPRQPSKPSQTSKPRRR